MKRENIVKLFKFVSRLTANYQAYARRDGNVYTLYIEYYTNHFENRPCSGDIRNGLFNITTTIKFIETKKGTLRILDAQTKGTTPRPENNWNGWSEISIHPKLTWNDIKRSHNAIFGKGEACNELYTTRKWVDNQLQHPTWEILSFGSNYERANPMENDLIRIKEAV